MTTVDFITDLFYRVDEAMKDVSKHSQAKHSQAKHSQAKHSQAKLFPSEVVTLGLLYALKGSGERAFYRWLERDYLPLFPNLPDRTRLFRLFATHQDWTDRFLAAPTLLGVIDSYGIEFIHPRREGRSKEQIGKKGKSNHRWIVGGKLCFILDQLGRIVGWDSDTANVYDATFHPLIRRYEGKMIVLGDHGFHSKDGDPENLKLCKRGQWNVRMLIETVLSMLTRVSQLKRGCHRLWEAFRARLAFTMAVYNLLIEWDGLKPDEQGFVHLSIARFAL